MNLLFWGLTISLLGKVMLAAGVLLAHSEIAHEHRIDAKVLRIFRIEMWITLFGLVLIVIGYFMEITFYGFTPLMDCGFENCSALLYGVAN